MLSSLQIKNFKNIHRLDLNNLATINLLTGKNNTGKTSVLEAIGLLASGLDLTWLRKIIEDRGYALVSQEKEIDLSVLEYLFYQNKISTNPEHAIFIGNRQQEKFISINFTNYIIRESESDEGVIKRTKIRVEDSNSDYLTGLEVSSPQQTQIISPDDRSYFLRPFRPNYYKIAKTNFQLIQSSLQEEERNSWLWDKITLTEKEDQVLAILQIIEPKLEKIAFVQEHGQSRRTVSAKIKGQEKRVMLKSMGDGINRILSIALALVNASQGYLLIDEFENGLHYSVQQQLWEIILKVAKRLNIQVFATTHSEDCITAFAQVINSEAYEGQGKLFRLERMGAEIKAVEYSDKELLTATEYRIETR
jgi:AAA15 family ATPase/GTPase